MTTVIDIRFFKTINGYDVAVLELDTITINGWKISKTNMVSQRDLEKFNIGVGSLVMITTKASGAPHLVLPPEMEKYNVYRA